MGIDMEALPGGLRRRPKADLSLTADRTGRWLAGGGRPDVLAAALRTFFGGPDLSSAPAGKPQPEACGTRNPSPFR